MQQDTAERDWLTAFLRECGGTCPLCRANLAGVETGVCPRCGRELALTVGAPEGYLRAWVVLAVAWSLCAGVGALVLAIVIDEGMPSRGRSPFLFTAVLFFIASIPVAVVALVRRRRFLRLAVAGQWWLAGASAALAVLGFALFAAGFALE